MENDFEDIHHYASRAAPRNTARAYKADWRHFSQWCLRKRVRTLPANPDDVAMYLRVLCEKERKKLSTVRRRIAALNEFHSRAGYDAPGDAWVVRKTLRRLYLEQDQKLTRSKGKAPLLLAEVKRLLAAAGSGLVGLRNRAMVLAAFVTGARRSELCALRIEDLANCSEGLVATITRTKTDRRREGEPVAIPYGKHAETCPVRAIQSWLQAAQIESGPLFRAINRHGQIGEEVLSGHALNAILKALCRKAALAPSRLGMHSFRAGMATQAAINGASEGEIQKQTGHRSREMVRRYIRDANLFRNTAATKLGL